MSDPFPEAGTSDLNARLETSERRNKRRFTVLLVAVIALLVLLVAAAGLGFWQLKKITDNQADLQFSDAVNDYTHDTDFVTVQIGVIQFLRRGFSITFDSAHYSEDGLTLTGTVGNPTELWISSLTLNFSVRPYPYQIRKKWNKENFIFYNPSAFEIGDAQVNVGLLNPGSTTPFTVTVPNVKQTKDAPQVAIWFSGERYRYLK